MEHIMKTVFIALDLFCVSTLAIYHCISESCFTLPDASSAQTFIRAKSWCQNNASSNLIVIDNNETRDTVRLLMNSLDINSTDLIYIDMSLQRTGDSTWYLVDGSNFYGGLPDQDTQAYLLYGYLLFYGGYWRVLGSKPETKQNFICGFSKTNCSTNSGAIDTIMYNGQCYIKYESEKVTWYEARKRCISNGGDLAMFNYPSSTPNFPIDVPFDTSKLNMNLSYWVGIRYRNWSWISPSDSENEILYDGWSNGKPNTFDYSCICLDPSGSPQWSWTDCDCNVMRSFLCLKHVPTTTSTTTTTTTTLTTTTTTTATTISLSLQKKLIIGLVVGIGGALLIIVIIIVVAVIFRRRKRRENAGGEGNIINSSQLGLDNHKKKRTEVSGDYSSANSVAQNAANADAQYAEVVVNSQPHGNTETDESKSEIMYTSFNQSLKSSKSLDSDEIDGVLFHNSRSQTIYSPSSNDDYATVT